MKNRKRKQNKARPAAPQPQSKLARRKGMRKRACRQFPGRPIAWRGGILYFLDTKQPVPGFPAEENAGGWAAAYRQPVEHIRVPLRQSYSAQSSLHQPDQPVRLRDPQTTSADEAWPWEWGDPWS